jgi:hypothetical protein
MRLEDSAIRVTIAWLFGPIVWAAHFFLTYGIAAFAGMSSDVTGDVTWQGQIRLVILLALAAVALLALVGFLVWQCRGVRGGRTEDTSSFLTRTAIALTVLALMGVIWTTVGTFIASF